MIFLSSPLAFVKRFSEDFQNLQYTSSIVIWPQKYCNTVSKAAQSPIYNVSSYLQTTDLSQADICTKHGGLHYMLTCHLSQQEVEVKVVVILQPTRLPNSWLQFESHHWIFIMRPGDTAICFLWQTKPAIFQTRSSQTISTCDRADPSSYLKPNHDLFLRGKEKVQS